MSNYSDRPYDDAKKRWTMIATYAAFFAVGSAIVKYAIMPHVGL